MIVPWIIGGALALLLLGGKRRAPGVPTMPAQQAYAPPDSPRVPMLRAPPKRGAADWPHEVMRLTNQRRAGTLCGYPPAAPLTWNGELASSAQRHAEDMSAQHYFSHVSLDGRTPTQRMQAAGFSTFPLGENIAQGQTSPAAVVADWVASSGHCRNLMGADYRQIGVGYANGYWVQNFGG